MADIDGGIDFDSGSMTVSDSAIIYGNANVGADVATLHVNGGTLIGMTQPSKTTARQVSVSCLRSIGKCRQHHRQERCCWYVLKELRTKCQRHLNDNDVGLDVYGGMSLPTP